MTSSPSLSGTVAGADQPITDLTAAPLPTAASSMPATVWADSWKAYSAPGFHVKRPRIAP